MKLLLFSASVALSVLTASPSNAAVDNEEAQSFVSFALKVSKKIPTLNLPDFLPLMGLAEYDEPADNEDDYDEDDPDPNMG